MEPVFEIVRRGDESLYLFLRGGQLSNVEEGQDVEEGEITDQPEAQNDLNIDKISNSNSAGVINTILTEAFDVPLVPSPSDVSAFDGNASEYTNYQQELDPSLQESLYMLQEYIGQEYYPKCLKRIMPRQTISGVRFGPPKVKTGSKNAHEGSKSWALEATKLLLGHKNLEKDDDVVICRPFDSLQFPSLFSDNFLAKLEESLPILLRFTKALVRENDDIHPKDKKTLKSRSVNALKEIVSKSFALQHKINDELHFLRAAFHFTFCGFPDSSRNCLCEICGLYSCKVTHGKDRCSETRCIKCLRKGHPFFRCYQSPEFWRESILNPTEEEYYQAVRNREGLSMCECIDCGYLGHISCSAILECGNDTSRFFQKQDDEKLRDSRSDRRDPPNAACATFCAFPKRYSYFDSFQRQHDTYRHPPSYSSGNSQYANSYGGDMRNKRPLPPPEREMSYGYSTHYRSSSSRTSDSNVEYLKRTRHF
eukprot:GHVP01039459.1.p1 GENE.GHVP01039459.1~~GHVP01039459.1.p1  ORF type:complete len:480 (+),score=59.07 GHVP01039459.1:30-1469(+)